MIQNKVLSFDEFRQFLSDSLGIADVASDPRCAFSE